MMTPAVLLTELLRSRDAVNGKHSVDRNDDCRYLLFTDRCGCVCPKRGQSNLTQLAQQPEPLDSSQRVPCSRKHCCWCQGLGRKSPWTQVSAQGRLCTASCLEAQKTRQHMQGGRGTGIVLTQALQTDQCELQASYRTITWLWEVVNSLDLILKRKMRVHHAELLGDEWEHL